MAQKNPPPKRPVPTPRPKPQPPIQPQPSDTLRDRRRLAAPADGVQEMSMKNNRKKGLGLAQDWGTKMRPANRRSDPDPRMPYVPGSSEAKPMPYTPGTGSMEKLPYTPTPRMKPVRHDRGMMDMGWDSRTPPDYATMEYRPERDGTAGADIPNWGGGDVGAENLGKQEYNRDWRYDNWRSEQGDPVPEDQANVYNDLFDEWDRKRPVTGTDENPTEVAQWERAARQAAREAGLSDEEIDRLIEDLYGE